MLSQLQSTSHIGRHFFPPMPHVSTSHRRTPLFFVHEEPDHQTRADAAQKSDPNQKQPNTRQMLKRETAAESCALKGDAH